MIVDNQGNEIEFNATIPPELGLTGTIYDNIFRWIDSIRDAFNNTFSGFLWGLKTNPIFSPFTSGLQTPIGTIPPWIFWLLLGLAGLMLLLWFINPMWLFALFSFISALGSRTAKNIQTTHRAISKKRKKKRITTVWSGLTDHFSGCCRCRKTRIRKKSTLFIRTV